MNKPLVSIIMPAYNAEKYIAAAIRSVLEQAYENWELIVINDGSSDNTRDIVLSFTDPRIILMDQPNKGVGAARNLGLSKMSGNYFCFLDADDKFTNESISARLQVFDEKPEVHFVDGQVKVMDQDMNSVLRVFKPSFRGFPETELARLRDNCYFGITWLIKRDHAYPYAFPVDQTHGEDLLFFLGIAHMGKYDYVNIPIYLYRQQSSSAMGNLNGLEMGYFQILGCIKDRKYLPCLSFLGLKIKVGKMMAFSYFKDKKILRGIQSFWLFLVRS